MTHSRIALLQWILTALAVLMTALGPSGCKKHDVLAPVDDTKGEWHLISDFAALDVGSMVHNENAMYVAGLWTDHRYTPNYLASVFRTTDGLSWQEIKRLTWGAGPMTMVGDTLFFLSDSVYRYIPGQACQTLFITPERLRDPTADGDLMFYGSNFYSMQSLFANAFQTFRIAPDGTSEELFVYNGWSYAGTKFMKVLQQGVERVYVRPHWNVGGFFRFDGNTFTRVEEGLEPSQLISSPSNAMAVRHDTLFAGFKRPGSIMILTNDRWSRVYDTLPYPACALQVNPPLRTEPTAIAFYKDRIFVATHCVGVVEWRGSSGWVAVSKGLLPGVISGIEDETLFHPVVFLESFKGHLFAAYGEPAYGPWGGTGVYRLALE